MAVRFPQFSTFDFGSVAGGVEQIKGQRLRNQINGMAVEDMKEADRTRQRVKEIRSQTENAGQAIQQLRADGMHEQADQLQQQALSMHKSTVELLEGMQDWVTDQETYDELRSNLLQGGVIEPDDMPVEYSKSFMSRKLAEARGKLSTFMQTVGVDADGLPIQRQVTQDGGGNVLAVSPEYVDPSDRNQLRLSRGDDGAGGGGGIKSADASLLLKAAAQLYGGFYSPETGQFQGLDKDSALRVQRLAERAEGYFKEGMSHNQAVARAGRELNLQIPAQPGDPDPNDPLGLRRQ